MRLRGPRWVACVVLCGLGCNEAPTPAAIAGSDEGTTTTEASTGAATTTTADDTSIGDPGRELPDDVPGREPVAPDAGVPELPPPLPRFVEVTVEAGLDVDPGDFAIAPFCILDNVVGASQAGDYCIPQRFLGAAAVGDLDGDDWPDVYLSSIHGPGHLMRNRGDGTFEDVAAAAGVLPAAAVGGAAWVDVEGDGDLDLALGIEGQNMALRNDGTGRFADATAAHLPAVVDETRVLTFADVDRDGDRDAFVGNVLQQLPGGAAQNFLLLDGGAGAFATAPAGRLPASFGAYGATFTDFDADGDPDLAIAHADLVNGANLVGFRLLRNDGTGAFTDISTQAFGAPIAEHAMAAVAADFDRDGKTDLFVCARGTFLGGAPIGFRDRLLRQR